MSNFKPMGGCTADLDKLVYPVYVSTKIDGMRVNIIDGLARTKSLKPISNVYTRDLLESFPVLEGCEAELTTTWDFSDEDAFNKATGDFRRFQGVPNVCMSIFDIFTNEPFRDRYRRLCNLELPNFARVLLQHLVNNRDELNRHILQAEELNFEGLMIHHANSLYKCGKATVKEGQSLKYKFMEDTEGILVGFEEGTINTNEKQTNELGRSKRSSSKAGLIPSGLVGTMLVQHPTWGIVRVSGLKDDLARDMFLNFENYSGLLVTFRYQAHGTLDAPRIAKFKGFRNPDDMTLPDLGDI